MIEDLSIFIKAKDISYTHNLKKAIIIMKIFRSVITLKS